MSTPASAPDNNGLLVDELADWLMASALDVPMIVSAEFAARVDEPLTSLGRHRLAGASREQEVFTLRGLAGDAAGVG